MRDGPTVRTSNELLIYLDKYKMKTWRLERFLWNINKVMFP